MMLLVGFQLLTLIVTCSSVSVSKSQMLFVCLRSFSNPEHCYHTYAVWFSQ